MSLPALAPVAELERRLGLAAGALTGSDLTRAEVSLDDASALVRDEAGKTWVAEDGVTITAPAVVVTVVLAAALRAYRNPDGYQGESVGDYSYQYARESTSGYLTDREVQLIRRAAGFGRTGVYTVSIRSPYEDPNGTDPFRAVTA